MSLEEAAQAMREAMRETVERHSLWYLVQGALMVIGGFLALVYPVLSSVGVVIFLGWLLYTGMRYNRRVGINHQRCRSRHQFDWCATGAAFLASTCLGRTVGHRRRDVCSSPGRRASHPYAPTYRVLHGRRHFESDLFVDDKALSQLGVGSWQAASSGSCWLSIFGPAFPSRRYGCLAHCWGYS